MFLGAVRLHLRMYTKFPRPRNRFHSQIQISNAPLNTPPYGAIAPSHSALPARFSWPGLQAVRRDFHHRRIAFELVNRSAR
jgi:hypothetical protein